MSEKKLNESHSILGNSVSLIENSFVDSEQYQPVVDRYYTPRYCNNIGERYGDYCILLHSNRICVVQLASHHILLTSGKQVQYIDFNVSKKVDRLDNRVFGKSKRGAQYIKSPEDILFKAVCTDGTEYKLCTGIMGKLVEVNEQLAKEPNLLITDPGGRGFLCCMIPKISKFEEFKDTFLTKEQYISSRTPIPLDVMNC